MEEISTANRNNNLFDHVSCLICRQSNHSVLFDQNYPIELNRSNLLKIYKSSSNTKLYDQLVKCNACNFVYISPRICNDIVNQSYEEAIDDTFFSQNIYRIETFSKYLNKICKILKINPKEKKYKVLDIGCAGGAFVKAASDFEFEAQGVEPSRWLAKKGSETYNVKISNGYLREQNYQEELFDIIFLWDVIEHMTDIDNSMEIISKILKKDGYLVVNIPDYDSIARKIFKRNWPFFLNVHLFYFTRKTLSQYLNQFGLEAFYSTPFFQNLGLGYILERAAFYFKVFKIFKKFATWLKIDNKSIMYNLGQTLVILRKK